MDMAGCLVCWRSGVDQCGWRSELLTAWYWRFFGEYLTLAAPWIIIDPAICRVIVIMLK